MKINIIHMQFDANSILLMNEFLVYDIYEAKNYDHAVAMSYVVSLIWIKMAQTVIDMIRFQYIYCSFLYFGKFR